jgi:hypothetical protein
MDSWWDNNSSQLKKLGLIFSGHVCATTTKGKDNRLEKEYKESQEKVQELISKNCCGRPWTMERKSWFKEIYILVAEACGLTLTSTASLKKALIKFARVPPAEADEICRTVRTRDLSLKNLH